MRTRYHGYTTYEPGKRRFETVCLLLLINPIINNTLKGNLALTQSIAMNVSENTASGRWNPIRGDESEDQ
jgi:hypothetical protein